MSEDTAPLVVTLKGGKDFSDPWIVVRGNTPDQVTGMLRNLGELPAATVEASNLFHAANNAAPILPNAPQSAPQQQAPAPAWGSAVPGQGFQSANPGQQWGGQPAQPAPQQQGSPGATLHPEGKSCPMDGKPLEYKRTQNGKGKWQCPDWRWNNGTPNGHAMEWAN